MEWYSQLIDNLSTIKTQLVKEAREATMKVAWEMGKCILESRENLEKNYGDKYIAHIAKDIGVSASTIRNSQKFAEKFADFEQIYLLPEGENISLHKIVHKYLYDPTQKKPKPLCKKCPEHCF